MAGKGRASDGLGALDEKVYPNVERYVGQKLGHADYSVTQFFKGHSYFKVYLRRMGKSERGGYPYCR